METHTFPIVENEARKLDALRSQLPRQSLSSRGGDFVRGHRNQTMWTVLGLLMTVGGYFIRRRLGRRVARRW